MKSKHLSLDTTGILSPNFLSSDNLLSQDPIRFTPQRQCTSSSNPFYLTSKSKGSNSKKTFKPKAQAPSPWLTGDTILGPTKLSDHLKKMDKTYDDNYLTNQDFFFNWEDFGKFKKETREKLQKTHGSKPPSDNKWMKPNIHRAYKRDKFVTQEMPDEAYSYVNQQHAELIQNTLIKREPSEVNPYFYRKMMKHFKDQVSIDGFNNIKWDMALHEKLDAVMKADYGFFRDFFKIRKFKSREPDRAYWDDY
jgi:hypothetical protein